MAGRSSTNEKPKPIRKRAYSFDSEGRLVDPEGNVIEDDEELADGFTPTLDDDGEVIGEAPAKKRKTAAKKPRKTAAKKVTAKKGGTGKATSKEAAPDPEEKPAAKPAEDEPAPVAEVAAAPTMSPKKEAFLVKMGLTEGSSVAAIVESKAVPYANQEKEKAVKTAEGNLDKKDGLADAKAEEPRETVDAVEPEVVEAEAETPAVPAEPAKPVKSESASPRKKMGGKAASAKREFRVDGDQPPAGVVESIPSWLAPMVNEGETMLCKKRSNLYEFCVFDDAFEEKWYFSIDPETLELRLIRDPSGNPVAERDAVVRPAAVAGDAAVEAPGESDTDGQAENAPTDAEAGDDGEASAAVEDAADPEGTSKEEAGEPSGDAGHDAEPVEAESQDAAVEGEAAGGSDNGPEATDAPAGETAAEATPKVAEAVEKPTIRNALLASRPELEHVEGRTFGEFLSDIMGARGIRPAELAVMLGVSRSSVYHYCSNSKRPSFDSLKFIADYFDCDVFKW